MNRSRIRFIGLQQWFRVPCSVPGSRFPVPRLTRGTGRSEWESRLLQYSPAVTRREVVRVRMIYRECAALIAELWRALTRCRHVSNFSRNATVAPRTCAARSTRDVSASRFAAGTYAFSSKPGSGVLSSAPHATRDTHHALESDICPTLPCSTSLERSGGTRASGCRPAVQASRVLARVRRDRRQGRVRCIPCR